MKIITLKSQLQTIVLMFLFLGIFSTMAQNNQLKKAEKIYDKYSYIDARAVYLNVVEKGYKSAEIYSKLGDTYYYNADYENGLKWYSRLYEEFPEEMTLEMYLKTIQSYKSVGNYEMANKLLDEFAKQNPKSQIVKNYLSNPNYLEDIISQSGKYIISKVAINTNYSDFSPMFFGEDMMIFASGNTKNEVHHWNNQPFFNLFTAHVDTLGNLSNKTEMLGKIQSDLNESSTALSPSGDTLYFTRNNLLTGIAARKDVMRHKLFSATLNNGDWKNISELPFNSEEFSVAHPAMSPDGKRLYFSSDREGSLGQSDIWFVTISRTNGKLNYGEPVNLGPKVNTESRDTFPFIDKDNILYFSSDGRPGLGGLDIYKVALGEDGIPKASVETFGEPVNSKQDDFSFIIDKQRNFIYLASNRGDSESNFDNIYFLKEHCEIIISGLISNASTNEPLSGATVYLMDENMKPLEKTIVGLDGIYTFTVNCEEQYSIRATKEEYNPKEAVVVTPATTSQIDLPLALVFKDPCPPNDLGCRLTLQPIYFDFDKHNIRPDAAIELAKILSALEQYEELEIHIESHTDSRGSNNYNEALSERRAQATRNWLIDRGVAPNRLTAKGYGESRLVNNCVDGKTCTEEQHQLNRRSMFIIKN